MRSAFICNKPLHVGVSMKHVESLLLFFYNFVTQQKFHTSPTFDFEL